MLVPIRTGRERLKTIDPMKNMSHSMALGSGNQGLSQKPAELV